MVTCCSRWPANPGRKDGKVQRGVDAVQVHVFDALMNIPCAPAHFVEPDRLEAVLGHRAPDHGVEPDVGQFLTVVDPGLSPAVGVHDLGRAVGELCAAGAR